MLGSSLACCTISRSWVCVSASGAGAAQAVVVVAMIAARAKAMDFIFAFLMFSWVVRLHGFMAKKTRNAKARDAQQSYVVAQKFKHAVATSYKRFFNRFLVLLD